MDELMEDTKTKRDPIHPIPKPQIPNLQQIPPQSQFGMPHILPSQIQFPKFQLETPQFTPTKLHPGLRTESEPAMHVNVKPNPVIGPFPNPSVSSPEALTDSQSLRKNSQRLRSPYVEPEEPEPQPNTSPPVLPRSRSTSVESESQQVSRTIRADRGIRGSGSPTPVVREAIYRKELVGSHEPDSASKPRRELEASDTFESELEAESQPGSDSDRDSDVE